MEMKKEEEGDSQVDLAGNAELLEAVKDKRWRDVKRLLDKQPDTIRAPITEFYETILHILVNYCKDADAIAHLKHIIDPDDDKPIVFEEAIVFEALEKTDYRGNTPLSVAASVRNAEAAKKIAKKKPDLLLKLNPRSQETPFHLAAKLRRDHTFKGMLHVAENDANIKTSLFSAPTDVGIVENLIAASHYGLTVELLNKYEKLGRNRAEERGKILRKLAQKPLAFKSGCDHVQGWDWARWIYKAGFSRIKKVNDILHPSHESQTKNNDDRLCIDIILNRDEDHQSPTPTHKDINLFDKCRQIASWMFQKLVIPQRVRDIYKTEMRNYEACQVVHLMCTDFTWTFENAQIALKEAALSAATLGIVEILEEILTVYPAAPVMFYNDENYNIFDVAVINCRYMVFDLLFIRCSTSSLEKVLNYPVLNKQQNNLLHFAGSCIPSRHINGAALQMQLEMQWFKAVETVVPPSFKEQRNSKNKTPIEVFEDEHKQLIEDAEQWMRDTASSCMVVDALIVAMVFAAIIAVPGNVDDHGIPNFRKETVFEVFVVADTAALFSSSFSLLLFVRILTSRYDEKDFLKALPNRLLLGIITLILSIAATLVASSSALIMLVDAVPGPKLLIRRSTVIPVTVLAALPVIFFIWSQSHLLIDILRATYRPPVSFKHKNDD
ncbi:hypothetical protein CCACVL1_27869 [Corchorus capsularis]|uniref:PGG domain-containing protein n=1 Tax=Corchorus capsularis TaxID=210143 RepID=A0A1R3G8D1_COCAP|nr:hypothetical protein CCACVL1_27869 [Corchorus capsularis]